MLQSPEMQKRIADFGAEIGGGTPEEFGQVHRHRDRALRPNRQALRRQARVSRRDASMIDATMPRTLFDKIWAAHVVMRARRRPERCSTSTATWCRTAPRRPSRCCASAAARAARRERAFATPDHYVPTDSRALGAHRRSARSAPWRRRCSDDARARRHPLLRPRRRAPGHRARRRPRAGPEPAGHADRLRRQPHLDARRARRARLRHRRDRGGARAGDADALAAQAADACASRSTGGSAPA